MKFKDLLSAVTIVDQRGILPKEIDAVYNDSRLVKPNGCFFCIVGFRYDGHDYLSAAEQAGATVAIVERFIDVPIAQVKVNNSRRAMALISSRFYGEPSKHLKVIGITATNGKTSTAFMVDSIFKAAKRRRAIIGTVKTEFAGFSAASLLTTPESLTLQSYLAQMRRAQVEFVTMEVSSIALELERVSAVDFDIVAFNNISREHTDQHGSFQNYIAQKQRLISQAKPSSCAVLNLDDTYAKQLLSKTTGDVISYAYQDSTADLVVESLDLTSGKAKMTVCLQRTVAIGAREIAPMRLSVEMAVAGFHSVMNSLSAIAIALAAGIDKRAIAEGLANFQGVERRFQIINQQPFKIIDDHFANAGNIEVTLKTLAMMPFKQLRLVYAIRGNRGVKTNRENALKIVEWSRRLAIDTVYASLSRSHVSWKDEVSAEELAVFEEVLTAAELAYSIDQTLDQAIDRALDDIQPEDILLLAGCQGMDCGAHVCYRLLKQRQVNFDQRQMYRTLADRVCCESE